MSSKKTTTSNQTTHQVQTPTNPDWVTSPLQGLTGDIGNLSSANPTSFVAGLDPLQIRANTSASGLGVPSNYGTASGILSSVAGAGPNTYAPTTGKASSVLDNLSAYYNPFAGQVINPVLADQDFNAGQVRAQQALNLAGSKAFGGSGAALTQSATEGQLARARSSALSPLLEDMYTSATGLANSDADRAQNMALANLAAENTAGQYNAGAADTALQRQLSAGTSLGDLAGAQDANTRANVALQGTLGDASRQVQQQLLSSPLSLLQARAGLLGSLPFNLFTGQTADGTAQGTTTETSSNPLGALGSLAMLASIPLTGGASLGALGALGGAGAAGGLGAFAAGAPTLGGSLLSKLGVK